MNIKGLAKQVSIVLFLLVPFLISGKLSALDEDNDSVVEVEISSASNTKIQAADEVTFAAITDCESQQSSQLDGDCPNNIAAAMAAITMLLLVDDRVDPNDIDGDGVLNDQDAFPNDPNESSDLDGDGVGDNSDPDRDGDGVDNSDDAFPNDPQENSDIDEDGVGDNADTDRDGDGVENEGDAFPNDPAESSDIDEDGVGDNTDPDRDGDGVENEEDAFPNDPLEDSDLDEDGVGDNSDPDRDGDGVDNQFDDFPDDSTQTAVAVSLIITSPGNGTVTTASQATITGQFSGPITSINVGGVGAEIDDDRFSATVVLEEGMNKLTAVGMYLTENGEEAITSTANLVRDTTPPEIILTSVRNAMVTTESQITIAGSLEDIRSNLSGLDEASVLVNGIQVDVVNRGFELADFLLQPGLNAINVVATDVAGNTSQKRVDINFLSNAGQRLIEVQGNNQQASSGLTLDEPLVVRLVDRNNVPIEGRAVSFNVVSGDGVVTDLPREGRELVVISNEQGLAEVNFQLGRRSGAGLHQVEATSIGFPGQIVFCASADALTPATISATRGSYQESLAGSLLPEPLVAKVVDGMANPVEGVDVVFTIDQGDGVFVDEDNNEFSELIRSTDVDGNVTVDFQIGSSVETQQTNGHMVRAIVAGQPDLNTTYAATSLIAGPVSATTMQGVVLDNSNIPLPGVQVTLSSNGSVDELLATTNEQGQFIIEDVPVGTVHLDFDANTSTANGDFPTLGFEMVTVSGRDNTLGLPVYIPRLDTQGGRIAGGNEQVVIPLAGVDGAEIIIAPNSVTLPDGSDEGLIRFSQVQNDKTPMPAPDGVFFDVAWTLQPSGTQFDPPARVSLPNTSSGSPGQEFDMVTFDHNLGEWVSMGPGVVSEDGARVISKLGFGIREAGWGGLCPPPDDTCNQTCDDGNECTNDSLTDCECQNEEVPERVLSDQEEFNCQTELCVGSEPDDSDFDPSTDTENDCSMPGCRNGSAVQDIPDDSDISDDDAVCNKCQDAQIVVDESKEGVSCSDEPGEECLVCMDGTCQPEECMASNEKVTVSSETFSFVVNQIQAVQNITTQLTNAIPFLEADIDAVLDFAGSRGMRCCKDCSNFDPEGVEFTEFKGRAGITGVARAGFGGINEQLPARSVAPGISVAGRLFVTVAGATLNINALGEVNAVLIPECEDEDCAAFRIGTPVEIDLGPTVDAELQVVACSSSDSACLDNPPVLLGVAGRATAGIGIRGFIGAEAATGEQCGRNCVGARADQIRLQALVSGQVEFVFKRVAFENEVTMVLFENLALGTSGCGG